MTDVLPPVVRTVEALRAQVGAWRAARERVALVPTMGALHNGHLSLVGLGKAQADRCVVSIFVNPTQFAPGEDFEAYPRDEAGDLAQLATVGCDLLYAPAVTEMYPQGAATIVRVGGVSEPLEGTSRPTHFDGVATIVTKLLIQAGPDVAVFGEKDYQQLQVIRQLVRDLDIPTTVLGGPTARAADGLALSSRNAYLSGDERARAAELARALRDAAAALRAGAPVAAAEAEAISRLAAAGFQPIDYLEVRDPTTLARLGPGPLRGEARILAAARLGRTRLIDNLAV